MFDILHSGLGVADHKTSFAESTERKESQFTKFVPIYYIRL